MPMPPSFKFTRNGIAYESNVDRANYTIQELTRAALRDAGRYIVRECTKEARKLPGLKRTKHVQKRYQFFVRKREGDLQIGIHNIAKDKNPGETWYGAQQELGTAGQPKRGIMRGVVHDNIRKIQEFEARYLSAIEDDMRALGLIESEDDYEGDGDDG